jgi:hypothetical protein
MNIAFPHDAIYYPFTLLRTGPSFGGAVGFYVPYVLSDGLGTVSGFCSPHTRPRFLFATRLYLEFLTYCNVDLWSVNQQTVTRVSSERCRSPPNSKQHPAKFR